MKFKRNFLETQVLKSYQYSIAYLPKYALIAAVRHNTLKRRGGGEKKHPTAHPTG